MRNAFAEETTELFGRNENLALILGDIGVYGFREVLEKYPSRAMNIGILEQSMIGVGAGMSSEGMIPIIHTIAPFLVERALEQIKIDFGYQGLPGNLVSVGASFDYSSLGCTHHCPGDVSILSNIPGLNIFIPGHEKEFRSSFKANWNNKSLNYFRLSEKTNLENFELGLGETQKLTSGNAACLVVIGPLLDEVRVAISGLDIELHYTNTLSSSLNLNLQSQFPGNKLIIVEPFYSGAISQHLNSTIESTELRILQIGVPRIFIRRYGSHDDLMRFVGLDAKSIRVKLEKFLAQ